MSELTVGCTVLVRPNPIHPRLAGKIGVLVAFSAGDRKWPVARHDHGGVRHGGNPIVKIPVFGRALFRVEDLEVIEEEIEQIR